jgi:hypothetical protein
MFPSVAKQHSTTKSNLLLINIAVLDVDQRAQHVLTKLFSFLPNLLQYLDKIRILLDVEGNLGLMVSIDGTTWQRLLFLIKFLSLFHRV